MKPVYDLQRSSRIVVLALLFAPVLAGAQSACSSDGQRAPVALMERFISADCANCWSAANTPRPARGAATLDWIVPGSLGDDAPLSAAATRDAIARLQSLGRDAPQRAFTLTTQVKPAGALRLRVARGPAVNDYVGVSIELRPRAALQGPASFWLALVETIPAGVEASPVTRYLVRNVLSPASIGIEQLSNSKSYRFIESRVMSFPAGADPQRLHLLGWVEDSQGRILAMAQSRCAGAQWAGGQHEPGG